MKIGYSRVSTARQGQPLETQREVLLDAGCDAQHLPQRHDQRHQLEPSRAL